MSRIMQDVPERTNLVCLKGSKRTPFYLFEAFTILASQKHSAANPLQLFDELQPVNEKRLVLSHTR